LNNALNIYTKQKAEATINIWKSG